MRKSNYDKKPFTWVDGCIWDGWHAILEKLKEQNEQCPDRKIVVECYQGVNMKEVLSHFGELSPALFFGRDRAHDGALYDGQCPVWLLCPFLVCGFFRQGESGDLPEANSKYKGTNRCMRAWSSRGVSGFRFVTLCGYGAMGNTTTFSAEGGPWFRGG